MKTHYLLSNKYKKPGWVIFIPSAILGILWMIFELEIPWLDVKTFSVFHEPFMGRFKFFTMAENNIADEILGILIIIGALFIAFSKEKNEDEFISNIRLESLVWATYLNYTILIFAIIVLTEMAFFWVLVFNMFTILVFFIIRFNWMIRRSIKSMGYEE